jgi:hypothetical protein
MLLQQMIREWVWPVVVGLGFAGLGARQTPVPRPAFAEPIAWLTDGARSGDSAVR